VDSGLGTFRGRNAGVWHPLKAMQIDFSEMSCPDVFEEDPRAAWAFWKFRYDAYTSSEPHEGYRMLAQWGSVMPKGCFSITSNIDGHWVRTIGDQWTFEMHGALTHMQRMDCGDESLGRPCPPPWPTDQDAMAKIRVAPWDLQPGESVEVRTRGAWEAQPASVGEDSASLARYDADGVGGPIKAEGVRRAGGPDLCRVLEGSPLPTDENGHAARPNVLMFGDGGFDPERIDQQERRYTQWLDDLDKSKDKLVVVEVGAGTAVPTIRMACESLLSPRRGCKRVCLVRINLDQNLVPEHLNAIGIGGHGALEAIRKLDVLVQEKRAKKNAPA